MYRWKCHLRFYAALSTLQIGRPELNTVDEQQQEYRRNRASQETELTVTTKFIFDVLSRYGEQKESEERSPAR